MRSKILTPIFILLALFASQAHAERLSEEMMERSQGCYRGARLPALVVNHDNIPLTTAGKKTLSTTDIQNLIIEAGRSMRRPWSIESQSPGKLLATLNVRGKHTVMVDITYSTTHYSIQYKDSVNMSHAVCEGYAFIHPNYNQWVKQLKESIDNKLAAFQ
ncbi:MAG: hypothetical protein C4516_08510 [Oxalobacter sp.]|nr:MAG: hypothetical protein C4516_08510 [Oxalobacter sp.]